jgi:hypothetical protein
MSRKSIFFSFLILVPGLVLAHQAFAQQLTEPVVRTTLDKLGQGSATDDFTITDAQDQQLNSLGADVRGSLIQSDTPCVLNPRDRRVLSHQFAACQGLFPPGMGPDQSAHTIKLAHPFPWHVLVITIPTDPGDNPSEKLVQYTWEYDFSTAPPQIQQILKGAEPRPGMSLFRLDGSAWQWVGYR